MLRRRTPDAVARPPFRVARTAPRHLWQTRTSRVLGNTWIRAGAGLAAMGTLTSLAFGNGAASSSPRHDSGVTVLTVAPAAGNDGALSTLLLTVAEPSPTPTRSTNDAQQVLAVASALASDGIPSTALSAYRQAAARADAASPACGISWPLLAAIGRVESDHGRADGAVLYTNGMSSPHIVGIALNGHGTALIHDSDQGKLDGDKVYDHAVGPMQFIPTTWTLYGVNVRGHGTPDPFNVFDAAAAAADYLCAAGGNLTTLAGQTRAVRAYNASDAYVKLVLATETVYARWAGVVVPTVPAGALPSTKPAPLPPADPGNPPGLQPGTPGNAGTPTSAVPSSSAPAASSPATTAPGSSSPPPPSTSPSDSPTPPSASPTPTPPPSTPTLPPTPSPSPTGAL